MAKTIQIRGVPEDVHKILRMRATEAGVSLSEYCLRELTRVADRPGNAEVLKHARARGGGIPSGLAAEIIREMRGEI